MTIITKLMLKGYATPMAICKMQDTTNNLFNSFMARKPQACERKVLKDLADAFVVENFMIDKSDNIRSKQKAVDSSIKKLLKKLKKLGIKNFDVMTLERAVHRAHIAASLM